jgi:hypothetical protein
VTEQACREDGGDGSLDVADAGGPQARQLFIRKDGGDGSIDVSDAGGPQARPLFIFISFTTLSFQDLITITRQFSAQQLLRVIHAPVNNPSIPILLITHINHKNGSCTTHRRSWTVVSERRKSTRK